MNLPIDFCAAPVFAVVSCRGNDNDACINQAAHGLADRVIPVRVHSRCS